VQRIYGAAQTPFARVLASAQVTPATAAQTEGRIKSFCLETSGDSKLESDLGPAPTPRLKVWQTKVKPPW
jgi:hypothetical protein